MKEKTTSKIVICAVVQWRHLVAVTKKASEFRLLFLVGHTAPHVATGNISRPHVATGNISRCVPETRGAETATGAKSQDIDIRG